jgi:hypothetical protein
VNAEQWEAALDSRAHSQRARALLDAIERNECDDVDAALEEVEGLTDEAARFAAIAKGGSTP